VLRKIKLFWEYLKKPMPLDEFEDYDEYWGKRGGGLCSPIRRAEIISEYIDPSSTILDIGCGDGTLIDYISKNNSPKEIIGVDISKKAIEYARKQGHEAYEMDITSNAFEAFMKENNFDYIVLTEVLEHVREPEKVILSIKESFNKSIFVSIPNSGCIIHRLRLLFGKFPVVVIIYHVKEHVRFWTHKDFLYWCDYLGFKVVNYKATSGIKIFNMDLGKVLVSLFAMQIVYELTKK